MYMCSRFSYSGQTVMPTQSFPYLPAHVLHRPMHAYLIPMPHLQSAHHMRGRLQSSPEARQWNGNMEAIAQGEGGEREVEEKEGRERVVKIERGIIEGEGEGEVGAEEGEEEG